jgi:hypothetical protein
MNPRKAGAVFIVLMVALIAYGCASFANVIDVGDSIGTGIIPSNLSLNNEQTISTIGDNSFKPVYVNKRTVVNVTNTTNVTVTNTTNVTGNVTGSNQ